MVLGPIDDERLQKIRKELTAEFQKPIPEAEIRKYLPGIAYRRNGVIHLTKLNNTPFMLNAELIETVEATPDTVISLVTGRKYLVREPVDEVRDKYISYKKEIEQPFTA